MSAAVLLLLIVCYSCGMVPNAFGACCFHDAPGFSLACNDGVTESYCNNANNTFTDTGFTPAFSVSTSCAQFASGGQLTCPGYSPLDYTDTFCRQAKAIDQDSLWSSCGDRTDVSFSSSMYDLFAVVRADDVTCDFEQSACICSVDADCLIIDSPGNNGTLCIETPRCIAGVCAFNYTAAALALNDNNDCTFDFCTGLDEVALVTVYAENGTGCIAQGVVGECDGAGVCVRVNANYAYVLSLLIV